MDYYPVSFCNHISIDTAKEITALILFLLLFVILYYTTTLLIITTATNISKKLKGKVYNKVKYDKIPKFPNTSHIITNANSQDKNAVFHIENCVAKNKYQWSIAKTIHPTSLH